MLRYSIVNPTYKPNGIWWTVWWTDLCGSPIELICFDSHNITMKGPKYRVRGFCVEYNAKTKLH